MFFRFVCALILAALVSMTGIVLEKQTLERKRDVSRQYYQLDLLLELHAQSRLRIQRLTSPSVRIAEGETLWSDPRDASFAIEQYLVTEAGRPSATGASRGAPSPGAPSPGAPSRGAPSSVNASPADAFRTTVPSESTPRSSRGSLPLLRWQQPVSADQGDPN